MSTSIQSGENKKIFCISIQRTGTTSVGDFFRHFGYSVAGWPVSCKNSWGNAWYNGDFESIFASEDFQRAQVFEDDPWWLPGFYKVLFHRFPGARFILFTRSSDSWFDSMISHSQGRTIGNTKLHCKMYRREKEYYQRLDNDVDFHPHDYVEDKLMRLDGLYPHYKDIYEIHNREVVDFFNAFSPSCLFTCRLEDQQKWQKLAKFIGFSADADFQIHSNKSLKSVTR